jgi:hypothetical protein
LWPATDHKKAIPIIDLYGTNDPVGTALFSQSKAPDGSAQAKLGLAFQECVGEFPAAICRPDLDPQSLVFENSKMHSDEVRRVKERVKP